MNNEPSNVPALCLTLRGRASWFGGPHDTGIQPWEGLALVHYMSQAPELFLPYLGMQDIALARRLNPEALYCAMRWDYTRTPKNVLLGCLVIVTTLDERFQCVCTPIDWGPHEKTGRLIDLSPGAFKTLRIRTDDEVRATLIKP